MFKNKKIILSLIFLLLFIIIVLLITLFSPKNSPVLNLFPTPTPYQIQNTGEAVPGAAGPSTANDVQKENELHLVYLLVSKTPFIGKNFSLYYSYKTDTFILYLNPLSKQEANDEFDNFLKGNGVLDRSWIENIFVTYITPMPTPAP